MEIFLRILLGLGIAALGAFLTIRSNKIIQWFGPISWVEAKLGGGGSSLVYKLSGIAISFIGFMIATDLWDAFLQATLGSILPKGL